ncbi:ATP-dependent protease La [Nadsonia fulvescens var. elongata DSM 6958]|uniref:Lon protease homolog n=1 Tax=Nadsonia fulvescens var. elongata DSM 6958 TaxID=857566 RepID=A0A1E3PN13_9ASCO|nr:ATP-dependent protease La [Nadsonia fulvescens var. elongata DSM 6958]
MLRANCKTPLVSVLRFRARSKANLINSPARLRILPSRCQFSSTVFDSQNAKAEKPYSFSQSRFDAFQKLAEESLPTWDIIKKLESLGYSPATPQCPSLLRNRFYPVDGGDPNSLLRQHYDPTHSDLSSTVFNETTRLDSHNHQSKHYGNVIGRHSSAKLSKDKPDQTQKMRIMRSSAGSRSSAASASDFSSTGTNSNGGAPRSPSTTKWPYRPPVIAIAVNRRPIFPGHVSLIRINDKNLIDGMNQSIAKRQGFIAVFLRTDTSIESNSFNSIEEIHQVGTFCQLVGMYKNAGDSPNQNTFTAVVYAHNRIKVTDFKPADSLDFVSLENKSGPQDGEAAKSGFTRGGAGSTAALESEKNDPQNSNLKSTISQYENDVYLDVVHEENTIVDTSIEFESNTKPTTSEETIHSELYERDPLDAATKGRAKVWPTESEEAVHSELYEKDPLDPNKKAGKGKANTKPTESEEAVHSELYETDPLDSTKKGESKHWPTESEEAIHSEIYELDPLDATQKVGGDKANTKPTASEEVVHSELYKADPLDISKKGKAKSWPTESEEVIHSELNAEDPLNAENKTQNISKDTCSRSKSMSNSLETPEPNNPDVGEGSVTVDKGRDPTSSEDIVYSELYEPDPLDSTAKGQSKVAAGRSESEQDIQADLYMPDPLTPAQKSLAKKWSNNSGESLNSKPSNRDSSKSANDDVSNSRMRNSTEIFSNGSSEGQSHQNSRPLDDPDCPTSFLKDYHVPIVISKDFNYEPFDLKQDFISYYSVDIKKILDQLALKVSALRMFLANASSSSNVNLALEDDPEQLINIAASVTKAEPEELQDILKSSDMETSLRKAHSILKSTYDFEVMLQKAEEMTDAKMGRKNYEYRLHEQLKYLQKELGLNADTKNVFLEKVQARAKKLQMPEEVQEVFDNEISKMESMEGNSAEYGISRNYVDILTSIPWGNYSKEQFNISKAKDELDKDHYGMKEVKERILEFIAIGKLRGEIEGKIICLVGPPGVGKTSIAKSIASALNRKFTRFSVGGMDDISELKGHRRTYVGALPGKIVQCFKKSGTMNPMILIDEIDKLAKSHRGDPASSLLEILDPEQNEKFMDHYLDVSLDISKAFFVCTANVLHTIPPPLLDRMEVIEVSGYVNEEKMVIAEHYLIPTSKKINGLEKLNVSVGKRALEELIKGYCRENGVRNLQKLIDRIFRKVAFNLVTELESSSFGKSDEVPKSQAKKSSEENEAKPISVNKEFERLIIPDTLKPIHISEPGLRKYLGPVPYISERMFEDAPIGVVLGLGWTENGGMPVYVESVTEQALNSHSKPKFKATGQIGKIMEESSSLSYSFAKMYMAKNFTGNRFFERAMVHLHFPQGGIPKDGPSAGVTMATSLLSLALNYPVATTLAMTGELTLTGKVLRIGGLKEKAIAAKRCGAQTIIFPQENWADWEEITSTVKKGLEPIPVSKYDDVFDTVFKNMDRKKATKVWKKEFEKIDDAHP